MKQKRLAIAGMTGALLLGAGTGVVLNLPSSAGASSNSVAAATTPTDPTATNDSGTSTDTGTGTATDTATGDHQPGQFLKDSLATLVTNGTITQAQADAITAAIEANRPAKGPGDGDGDHGGPGMGRHGGPGMGGRRGPGLDTAATALGITADELRTELESGKSIADVATAKGVDVQKVIDALVAEETARITDMVNGVKPAAPADQGTTDPAATPSSTATNG